MCGVYPAWEATKTHRASHGWSFALGSGQSISIYSEFISIYFNLFRIRNEKLYLISLPSYCS